MTTDPVALAAAAAIDQLVTLLAEARTYLDQRETRAALGTLILFDDHADDLRAAVRLLRMAERSAQGRRR